MIKSLEQIKKDYEENFSNISFPEYLKNEIDNGLEINTGEVYYLLQTNNCKDVDIHSVINEDDYDIHAGVTVFPREDSEYNNYPFIVQDVLGLEKELGMKEELLYLDYSFPCYKDMINYYIESKKDKVIITDAYVSTIAFPENKYYCSACYNVSEEEKIGKFDVPFDEALEISCNFLESLGFININYYVQYQNKVAYIYPNELGKKIIEYINMTVD